MFQKNVTLCRVVINIKNRKILKIFKKNVDKRNGYRLNRRPFHR